MTWLAIKAILRGIPAWVWILLFLVASHATVYYMGYADGVEREASKRQKVEAKFEAYQESVREAAKRQIAQNKAREEAHRKAFEEIAKRHKEEVANAKAETDRIIADLRAGNVKLRDHWRTCATPEAAASSEGTDENARLREESAGRIIGNAAEADSWIRALQDVIRQMQSYPANTEPEVLQDK